VDAANNATIVLLFNYDDAANTGNNTLAQFDVAGTKLDVGDLFLTVGGVIKYGIALKQHAGSPALNGGQTGQTVLANTLYQVNNPSTTGPNNGVMNAFQILNRGTIASTDYRPTYPVWLHNDGAGSISALGAVTTTIALTGSTGTGIGGNAQAQYMVTLSFVAPGDWATSFNTAALGGVSFVSTTCANDILDNAALAIPEPGTLLLFGVGLAAVAMAGRRRIAV